MDLKQFTILITGLIIGIAAAWIIRRLSSQSADSLHQSKSDELNKSISDLKAVNSRLEERTKLQSEHISKLEVKNENLENEKSSLSLNLTTARAENSHLGKKLEEQLNEIEAMQAKFTKDFKIIATEILENNSQKFTKQNKENLNQILNPLGVKIKEFQKDISEKYTDETKERSALKNELKNLVTLNLQMSKEANNLTKALKGDSKTQGNWGELILQKILENSGLAEGREFSMQKAYQNEDGTRLLPDVIIHLPDNRNMIIDSKVSLTAYERYSSSEDKEEKKEALKEHILSLRAHIKELSGKKYQNIYEINSPDYVLMFLPVESAFVLAAENEQSLYTEALRNNITIVYPTSLMATLKTVEHTWKQDKQKKYALQIAEESGRLYDKFVGFLNDLNNIGDKIDKSKSAYEDALNKISSGKGNLIEKAEKIKNLGAKATKSIPESLVHVALESEKSTEIPKEPTESQQN